MLPTKAQMSALLWLRNRNGDGVFDRNQVLLAGGERAPYMRGTWTKLAEHEFVEFYHDRRRLRLTELGEHANLDGVSENAAADDYDEEIE